MKHLASRVSCILLTLGLVATLPAADRADDTAGRIVGAELVDSRVWDKLVYLTGRIGHRLRGPAGLARAGRWAGIVKTLGPGILFAGAAIGGSHLHWSTKAGAIYGFALVWIVIGVNLFKYPFFEFCRRYTVATGESMLQGYQRLGRGPLLIFLAICRVAGFINIAAVTALIDGATGRVELDR